MLKYEIIISRIWKFYDMTEIARQLIIWSDRKLIFFPIMF